MSKMKKFTSLLVMCLILTSTITLFFLRKIDRQLEKHIISLDYNESHIQNIPDKFLSLGLDTSLLRNMKDFPINNEKFIKLAQHLKPAYVRIGGTASDCLYFNQTKTESKSNSLRPEDLKVHMVDDQDVSNFTITGNDFLSLYEFTQKAQINMIFDLNVLLRNPDGSWNIDNAKEIINFANSHGMKLDWQIGNEPNSFFHVFNVKISAEQLAKDYCKLRAILNESGYQDSILIGPEANHIGDEDQKGALYAEEFLKNVNNCVDYVTWHQYYLNGHIAQVQDFVNPLVFNRLPDQINTMAKTIESSGKNISMWISETSSAYGGGAYELSDRFVAGFLWLDKLGYSAKAGVRVIIRQSFYGGNYALVGNDLNPNPDWWVAVIFKKMVSEKVLNLNTPNNFGKLRLYAHCASKSIRNGKLPGITIYGMNLKEEETQIQIVGPFKDSQIFAYFLTSDSLQSRNIFMNGENLKLRNDGRLPPFKPNILKANDVIVLPPYSIFFLVIHNMPNIAACTETH